MSADEHLTATSELCLPGSIGPTSAQLARAQQELADMREQLAVVSTGRDHANEALTEVEQERDALSAELTSARTELTHLREHQEVRARKLREKQAEIDRLDLMLTKTQMANEALLAGGQELVRQRRAAEDRVRELAAQLGEARTDADVLRDEQRHCRCRDIEEKSMTTSGVVCIVTPTIMDGTVVRWYRSEIAAETRREMISASRNGVKIGEHLTNGEVPSVVAALAAQAWAVLRENNGADMSSWATHRRGRVLGSSIVPVRREAADV